MARYIEPVEFPFLCLLISGGHTQLVYARGIGNYTQVGSTLDDSIGEVIDKVALAMGFEYDKRNGPAAGMAEYCSNAFDDNCTGHNFPMLATGSLRGSYDFSFSGLKTAVLEKIANESNRKTYARPFLDACLAQLEDRITRSVTLISEQHLECNALIISGGVACNDYIFSRYPRLGGIK